MCDVCVCVDRGYGRVLKSREENHIEFHMEFLIPLNDSLTLCKIQVILSNLRNIWETEMQFSFSEM